MSQSWESIDYQIRPGKAIERKMMAQIFTRLSVFAPIETYRYVGMGSVYFSDFLVFHTTCGFTKMISIEDEHDPAKQKRFNFNVPVGCIEIVFERTTAALPELGWQERSIVWLDYDGGLSKSVLSDMSYTLDKLQSGSLFAISVKADRHGVNDKKTLTRRLEEAAGREKIPKIALEVDEVDQSTYTRVLYQVFSEELVRALQRRNSGKEKAEKVIAKQVFYYTYKDGAPMMTIGWLILNSADYELSKLCRFSSFRHVKTGNTPFDIRIPRLTPAEMRVLSRLDPSEKYEKAKDLPLPKEHVELFRLVERYWPMPAFAELV